MRRPFAMSVLALLLCSCSGGMSSRDKLADSLTVFCDALRWQQYDQLSNYLPPPRRKAYIEARDHLPDEIDVTDVTIRRRTAAADGKSAVVRLTFSWIAKNDPVVQKTVFEQRWERRGDTWLMVREKRVRGTPLPRPPQRASSQPASQKQ